MSETNETIAILGGTGDQGLGLALRFCQSGRRVVIGSRKDERALEAAENVRSNRILSVHSTEEEAEAAKKSMDHPEQCEVWQA